MVGDNEGFSGCDGAFGTAGFVTGAFGFAAAKACVDELISEEGGRGGSS